jgi:hypothetical protein
MVLPSSLIVVSGILSAWGGASSWTEGVLIALAGMGAIVVIPRVGAKLSMRSYPGEAARCPRVRKWDRIVFLASTVEVVLLCLVLGSVAAFTAFYRGDLSPARAEELTRLMDWLYAWYNYGFYAFMGILVALFVVHVVAVFGREGAIKAVVARVRAPTESPQGPAIQG